MILEHIGLPELNNAAHEIISFAGEEKLWAFYGEMGAGKTTLIKAICDALGIKDEVSSPTFSLVNEYRTAEGQTVYHFDFYRIRQLEEVYDIGYEDYFFSGSICLVEWPELVAPLLDGEKRLEIRITKTDEGHRTILCKKVN